MSASVQVDYRVRLLRAVRGFLSDNSAARARAEHIVVTCPHPNRFTVDDMVWGAVITELGDSVFQHDPDYLEELRHFLDGVSGLIRRGYINYDLRSEMKPYELAQYQRLLEMLDFLDRFPYPSLTEALTDYGHMREEVIALSISADGASPDSNQPIHRLVLREVAAVALNIDIRKSALLARRLTPASPLVSIQPYRRQPLYPDATGSLSWARRALRAIIGQDWLYASWQIRSQQLWFALH